ncbi:hypothetical protein L9F63_017702 [Diploptera punctata]|uniref:Uncharacterized protein n=1 Tax=Diploptera punctata TaxID=6984 RepID=A0AAD7ZZE8_DIPPU|nr:hypothetical protein L9F63_017702 [Diploptera punctata]
MDTYYEILGCDRNATYEELKRRYQELVLIHHPDKQVHNLGFSNNTFMKIDEAWKVLKDPEKKRDYDTQLKHEELSENPMVNETLQVTDLEQNKFDLTYSYLCRCGGKIIIEHSDVGIDDCFVSCDNCSLIICIKGNEEISNKRTE